MGDEVRRCGFVDEEEGRVKGEIETSVEIVISEFSSDSSLQA